MLDKIFKKIQKEIAKGEDFFDFLGHIDELQMAGCQEMEMRGVGQEYSKAFFLKISNFLVGKYQYVNRHNYLISSPYALVVDPANGCPLHCPGCLHNRIFKEKINPDWPSGLLTRETFDCFIKRYGPYAASVQFYNWGEPLLNKNTPYFIRRAKSYLLNTYLSSNLSVEFDAEALVLSGLDYMILSIDGTSKESYERYRQGGDFDLVIANVKKIVAAKKKYNMATPILSWQFLLFEHNREDVKLVKKMAHDLGVNDVKFSTPYDVIWDEDLNIADGAKTETYVVGYETDRRSLPCNSEQNISKDFEEANVIQWQRRLPAEKEAVTFLQQKGRTCKWLYAALVMDSTGRFLPCCYAPRKDSGFTWVFGNIDIKNYHFNSEFYRFSRQHFTGESGLKNKNGALPQLKDGKPAPYCVACPNKNIKLIVNEEYLQRYIKNLDTCALLTTANIEVVANWD